MKGNPNGGVGIWRATGQESVQGEQNGLKDDEKVAAPTDERPKGEWLLAFWMAAWPRPTGRSTSDPCAQGAMAVESVGVRSARRARAKESRVLSGDE
jgi:hypothetical protein